MQQRGYYGYRDGISDILKAYRLPLFIVTFGMILSILSFLLVLRYDVYKSRQDFIYFSDQVYNNLQAEIVRHQRQASTLGRVLSQLDNYSGTEFSNIVQAIIANSYFTHIDIYQVKKTEEDNINISRYLSDFPLRHINFLQVDTLQDVLEKSLKLNLEFVSRPYDIKIDEQNKKYVIISVPLLEKKVKGLFLVFVLDLKPLFNTNFKKDNYQLNMRVFSMDTPKINHAFGEKNQKLLVYESYLSDADQNFIQSLQNDGFASLNREKEYYFPDYIWKIEFFPSVQGFGKQIGLFPLFSFASAIIITVLLSFIVFRIKGEQVRTQEIVIKQTRHLKEYTKKLEDSNRELDDFVYVVSHDLKEPLRGLYSYSQFLQEDYADQLDENGNDKLNTLKSLSIRMEELINTLLHYSRLGRSEEALKQTDLNITLKNTLDLLQPVIEENKADVQIERELPTIFCDRAHVGDIFRNLIVNAMKYNDSSPKKVRIGYEVKHKHNLSKTIFYVRDNGIGIDPKFHDSVFKMFKRLHGKNDYGGGTGSGLTIVKKIIDRHQGKIWIESNPEGGSTFYFTLSKHE